MRKKWIFTGAAFALAMTLTGCRDNAPASIPQQSSQEQTKEQTLMIPMEEAQEAALKAADIEAADADISATTLGEVAGVASIRWNLLPESMPTPTRSMQRQELSWK